MLVVPAGCWLVALRKESVDRNTNSLDDILAGVKSLSARRAWIEIPLRGGPWGRRRVALRKESVDRNLNSIKRLAMSVVALRKESVDRNTS